VAVFLVVRFVTVAEGIMELFTLRLSCFFWVPWKLDDVKTGVSTRISGPLQIRRWREKRILKKGKETGLIAKTNKPFFSKPLQTRKRFSTL
jgi:hypothetical protein